MNKPLALILSILMGAGSILAPLVPGSALAFSIRTVDLVDTNAAGVPADSSAGGPKQCAGGNYVGFNSSATNLVPGNTNYMSFGYVKNLQNGAIVRLGDMLDGTLANSGTYIQDFSGDCNLVLFTSTATNIVPGATTGVNQLYSFNRLSNAYGLVSSASDGTPGNGNINGDLGSAYGGHISSNGHYAAFATLANNLAPGDTNPRSDIYRKDLITGAISLISTQLFPSTSASYNPSISNDGRYIVFDSSEILTTRGSGGTFEIFRYDNVTGRIDQIAPTFDPNDEGNYSNHYATLSGDGSRVLYQSVYQGPPTYAARPIRIYEWDASTAQSVLLPMTQSGNLSTANTDEVVISNDGTKALFASAGSDIVSMPAVSSSQLYERDLVNGTTTLVSQNTNGVASDYTGAGVLSADGSVVVYSGYYPGVSAGIFVVNNPYDDSIPPTVTGAPDRGPGAAGWYNADVTINWIATDPVPSSGIPTTVPPTVASLEGTHTYTSEPSCDPAGNCATGSLMLNIDKTAPSIGSYGPLTKNVNDPLLLTAPASDAGSGVAGGEYFVGTDPGQGNGVAMTYSGGILSAASNDNALAILSAGTYQLNVRAKDAAGNWTAPAATTQLTVVLPAPTGLNAMTPTNNAPVLTWNAVPTATSYQIWREDTLTSTDIQAGSSATTNFTDVYAPGVYKYRVVAVAFNGTTSVKSAPFQVAVTNTSNNANNILAQGQSELMPVFGLDVLPGLTANSNVKASFDFSVSYSSALNIKRPLTLTFNAGGHSLFINSTSIDWMVVSGANNELGTFQGIANVNLDGASSARPFTVTAKDGTRTSPASANNFSLTVYMDSSRSTVLYSVNEALTKGKIKIN